MLFNVFLNDGENIFPVKGAFMNDELCQNLTLKKYYLL